MNQEKPAPKITPGGRLFFKHPRHSNPSFDKKEGGQWPALLSL